MNTSTEYTGIPRPTAFLDLPDNIVGSLLITANVLLVTELDTSPPFTPTEDGLATKAIRPNMKVDNGNIKFDSLTATGIGTITALSTGLSETSNNKVTIDTPSGTFKIMCE